MIDKKQIEINLLDELIEALKRNIDKNPNAMYMGYEIIDWLKRQKEIIKQND